MEISKNLSDSKYFVAGLALGSGVITSLVLNLLNKAEQASEAANAAT